MKINGTYLIINFYNLFLKIKNKILQIPSSLIFVYDLSVLFQKSYFASSFLFFMSVTKHSSFLLNDTHQTTKVAQGSRPLFVGVVKLHHGVLDGVVIVNQGVRRTCLLKAHNGRSGFTTSVDLIFPLLLPLSFILSLNFSLVCLCGLLL